MAPLGALKTVSAGALLLAATGLTAQAAQEAPEPFLRSPEGPYRGTVLDATTSRPIPDAAVVIIWEEPDAHFPGRNQRVAIRETLTDGAGRFVLDVAQTEARLLPRVFPPRILIYRPGYTAFPLKLREFPAPGAPARQFAGAGLTVRLTPLTDPEDRAEVFNEILESDLWGNEAPVLWELMKFELENFGYKPPKPPGSPK